jgi:gas vesicle protein
MLGTLFKLAGGLVLGAAAGAAVGILLAPKSGTDLQSDLRAYVENVKAAGRDAEAQRRQELQTKFAQAKQFNQSG